ncbi:TPA: hypothetical protein N2A14_002581 [Pseudomonas aeruginosa]|nr:hypothetical protein [Pseudomonas aeruginosa]
MVSATTELSAINTMLSTIGEAPVNTVSDSGVVDAVIARQILQTVSREVQARGWHWNIDKDFLLTPSFPEKEIILSPTTLRIDTVGPDEGIDVVLRGTRLYDRRNHTYQFDNPITVDIVSMLEFDELPEIARQYIAIRASRIFQERVVGSETLSTFSAKDEIRLLTALRDMEAETADYNILSDNYSVARVLDR